MELRSQILDANRVELDLMADSCPHGCRIVEEDEASAIVINTCAVTAVVEAKTRKAAKSSAMPELLW